MINFWWWEFGLSELGALDFRLFVFVIFYASLFYFLCALLFPDDMKDYAGFQDYFMSRRQWFFGILALINVVDILDTLLKGRAYFESFGLEYPIETAAHIVLCGVAIADGEPRLSGELRRGQPRLRGHLDPPPFRYAAQSRMSGGSGERRRGLAGSCRNGADVAPFREGRHPCAMAC